MFDPAQPAPHSPLSSAVMRSQLTSLKALIDAITTLSQAQVDSVQTLPAGTPATVSVTVTGDTLHFTFAIPQGVEGAEGPPGEVSTQQLEDAVAQRAYAIPGVQTLDQSAEAEYSPTQMQDVINLLNEMVIALKGN